MSTSAQPSLFDEPPPGLPEGFVHRPDFISPDEEAVLVRQLEPLPFVPFQFHGFEGNRRVVSFGWRYDFNEGGLKRAEEAQEQAAALKRQYEEQLAGLRAEAARIRDDARADGNRIRAELREQAEQEAERIRQRGDEQLAAQREQAVRQLRGEIGGLSVQLAERIIGTSLADDTRRRQTIDAFLDELDQQADRARTASVWTGGAG